MLKEGTPAPDFETTLDTGERFSLSEQMGKQNIVLYFYPKDFTMGCTREACTFRDNYDEIKQYDATIIGVSTDSEDSHQRFREKHELPFPLVADPEKKLVKLYDASGLLGLTTARATYVIDKQGTIRLAMRNDFMVGRHLTGVIDALREIEPAKA
jgi:peroxiredoxin Q/BCP